MLFGMTAGKRSHKGKRQPQACGTQREGLASHVDDEYGWKEIRLVETGETLMELKMRSLGLMTQRSSTAVEALNFLNDRLTWEKATFPDHGVAADGVHVSSNYASSLYAQYKLKKSKTRKWTRKKQGISASCVRKPVYKCIWIVVHEATQRQYVHITKVKSRE